MRQPTALIVLVWVLGGGPAEAQSESAYGEPDYAEAAAVLGRTIFNPDLFEADLYPPGPDLGIEYVSDRGWPVWSLALFRMRDGSWRAHMVRAPAPPPDAIEGLTPGDEDFRPRWRADYLMELYLAAIRAAPASPRSEILANLPVERYDAGPDTCPEASELIGSLDTASWDLEEGASRAFGDEVVIVTHADSLTVRTSHRYSTVQVRGMILDGYITGRAQAFADAVATCAAAAAAR